jgi:hypothetical protein
MTVAEVMLNLRRALLAVVPTVEAVGIPWCRPDAYDEWDAIAASLYNALVVEVLRWSLPEPLRAGFKLPEYDLLVPSYAGLCTVEVLHSLLPDGRNVFHAFGTSSEPFDMVEVRMVSSGGNPYGQELATCPVAGARLHLRLDPELSGSQLIEEVNIRH